MKAILEFNLPEDERQHMLAVKACDYKMVIDDIFKNLREKIKYQSDKHSDKEMALLYKLQEEFSEITEEYGVKEC